MLEHYYNGTFYNFYFKNWQEVCKSHSAYKFWRVFNNAVDAIMKIEYEEYLISAVLRSFFCKQEQN